MRTNGTDYILTAQDMADYIDMYRSSVADLTNPYFAPLTAHDLSNQPRTLVLSAEYCRSETRTKRTPVACNW